MRNGGIKMNKETLLEKIRDKIIFNERMLILLKDSTETLKKIERITQDCIYNNIEIPPIMVGEINAILGRR